MQLHGNGREDGMQFHRPSWFDCLPPPLVRPGTPPIPSLSFGHVYSKASSQLRWVHRDTNREVHPDVICGVHLGRDTYLSPRSAARHSYVPVTTKKRYLVRFSPVQTGSNGVCKDLKCWLNWITMFLFKRHVSLGSKFIVDFQQFISWYL